MATDSKTLAADCERLLEICRAVGSAAAEIDSLRSELAKAKAELEKAKPKPAVKISGGPRPLNKDQTVRALELWARAAVHQAFKAERPDAVFSYYVWAAIRDGYTSVDSEAMNKSQCPARLHAWAQLVCSALHLANIQTDLKASSSLSLTDNGNVATLTLNEMKRGEAAFVLKVRWDESLRELLATVRWSLTPGEVPDYLEKFLASLYAS